MKNLNIGLVGCGVMGRSLATALTQIDSAKLVVVYDPDRESANAAGKEYGVPSETDLAKVLGRKKLDGIIAAPPPFKHKEVAVAAAKAGKHVFMEKPLAANVRDCDTIIRAADRAKIKLMVGQVCRYHGIHRKVKDLVEEGAVGFLHSSNVSAIGGYGGRLDGSEGTLHFPSIWGEGAGIHWKRWEEDAQFMPSSELVVPNPVQAEIGAWLDCIREDTDPPIPGPEGRAAVQIAEAAYDSIETGKPVEL